MIRYEMRGSFSLHKSERLREFAGLEQGMRGVMAEKQGRVGNQILVEQILPQFQGLM